MFSHNFIPSCQLLADLEVRLISNRLYWYWLTGNTYWNITLKDRERERESVYVTEFWKTYHLHTSEIIRISNFAAL